MLARRARYSNASNWHVAVEATAVLVTRRNLTAASDGQAVVQADALSSESGKGNRVLAYGSMGSRAISSAMILSRLYVAQKAYSN